MEYEEETPVVESRSLLGACIGRGGVPVDEESSPDDSLRAAPPGVENMSQSYHEIFDTQGFRMNATCPPRPPSHDPVLPEVYYSDGRLVCGEDSSATQYLTSKLVADSLMWQQTFRNDSPSPGGDDDPNTTSPSATTPTLSLNDSMASLAIAKPADIDIGVLGDIEREARRLATEVDSLVESLACILQGVSALTVDTVQTYRDGVCKTCDDVDNNIKAMYQLMAKWEELNKNMSPVHKTAAQVKEIKRLLEMFELAVGTS